MLDWNEVSWENGDRGQNFMSSQVTRTLPCWSTFCSYQIAWKLWVMRPAGHSKALKPIDPGGHTHLQNLSLTVWVKPSVSRAQEFVPRKPAFLLMECSSYPIIPLAQVKDRGSQSRQVRQWKKQGTSATALWWVGCGVSGRRRPAGEWGEIQPCSCSDLFGDLLQVSCLAPLPTSFLCVHRRVEDDPELHCLDPNAGFLGAYWLCDLSEVS